MKAARTLVAIALLAAFVVPAALPASAADPTLSITPTAVRSNTLYALNASIVTLTGSNVSYRVDADNATPYTFPFDLSALPEGNHTLAFWSPPANASAPSQTINFVIDASPPNLSLDYPGDYIWIRSDTVRLGWTSSDNGSGLASIQVRIDGGSWTDPTGPTFHDFVGVPNGKHLLSVRATDRLGLASERFTRITLDTEGPELTILSPTPGQMVSRALPDLLIAWDVKDVNSGLALVQLIMDGGAPIVVTNVSKYAWHLPSPGTHSFVLRAVDSNGVVTQVGASFTVVNETAPPSAPPVDLASVVLFTLVAMIVGAALPGMFKTHPEGPPAKAAQVEARAKAKPSARLKDPGPGESPDADE